LNATGREAGVIAQGKKDEETEKRLGAILRYGDPVIAIDNCEQPISGDFLCQLLTQTVVRVRILGLSEAPELPQPRRWYSQRAITSPYRGTCRAAP
jgi:hypothetical protein